MGRKDVWIAFLTGNRWRKSLGGRATETHNGGYLVVERGVEINVGPRVGGRNETQSGS